LSGFATPGSYYIIRTVEQRRGSLVSVALKLIANDRFATKQLLLKIKSGNDELFNVLFI